MKAYDKPRVERVVPYVRRNFFHGEVFTDLADAQRRAEQWCLQTAGMRIHGTTQCRPVEQFRAGEQELLLPRPGQPFDLPKWSEPKVHRDFHVEVGKALYSVHHSLVGKTLKARADSQTVKLYLSGQLVKVWPRKAPGTVSSDPADFPKGKEIYAMRDVESLKNRAASAGQSVGAYASEILSHPLPWTKMRQVYRLLGLVDKWGADKVETACAKALEAEAIDVNLISKMIERALENTEPGQRPDAVVIQGRFARDPGEFETKSRAGK